MLPVRKTWHGHLASGGVSVIQVLGWLGRHAPVVLIAGCAIAFLFPETASIMRPALPVLVSLVLGASMAQLNPRHVLPEILSVSRLPALFALAVVLMPGTSLIYALIFGLTGMPQRSLELAVVLAAAPPIASATALCQFIGLNGRRALEVSLVATVLTPLLGPLTLAILLPELEAIDPFRLAARLAAIIVGGWIIAAVISIPLRKRGRSAADNTRILNGISVVAMILFLIPVFDGVGARLIDDPVTGSSVFGLAVLLNLGVNGTVYFIARKTLGRRDSGTLGLLWGNRNAAVYLAALPPDPYLGMFIALYQFPMYFTPFLVRILIRFRDRAAQIPR